MKSHYDIAIASLERHYDLHLPRAFKTWASRGYCDPAADDSKYLWVPDAEWISLDEIVERKFWRTNLVPGLIPFSFTGAGDNWCWYSTKFTNDSEYEILVCWNDQELADRFAPHFNGWFSRACLD